MTLKYLQDWRRYLHVSKMEYFRLPSSRLPSCLLSLLLLSHFSRVRLCVTPQTAATRLPHPWDSPGKNTGLGCHFLLQCRKVKSESEVYQSCLILSDPIDCSVPGSSVHGIFQARVLEWVSIAFFVIIASYIYIYIWICFIKAQT